MTSLPALEAKKAAVTAWIQELRDRIVTRFEDLEKTVCDPHTDEGILPRFKVQEWKRQDPSSADAGGGMMSIMRGGVFEKAGVHIATVHGELAPSIRESIPGTANSPRFWASGISLIAHTCNPNIPAVHMNTRMMITEKMWFAGGADLTPMIESRRNQDHPDTRDFHAALREACNAHAPEDYDRYRQWCDEYFFLPHRGKTRGVGGIFYDNLNSGDWEKDFRFMQDVGTALLTVYPQIVERNINLPWGANEREEQLKYRGYYAEFNLLYDRGTAFGLKTGGNIEAILSSLPPLAKWP